MPGRRSVPRTPAISQLQKQAEELVVNLRKEIWSKEAELNQLREEERNLLSLVGQRVVAPGAKQGVPRGSSARINWNSVLEEMPKQFKAGDVRKMRALKNKRPSEIFAAITRWIEAGGVKRKERGFYERMQRSQGAKRTGKQ
jgi:hypothetical protein